VLAAASLTAASSLNSLESISIFITVSIETSGPAQPGPASGESWQCLVVLSRRRKRKKKEEGIVIQYI
jgi:hypothetical protein